MSGTTHWTDTVSLRPELIDQHGQIIDLRMSLYDVVYQTADVPYQQVDYYGDITDPTPGLRRVMGQVMARLGSQSPSAQAEPALYHLDQGMGGGKSHALVGLHHMVNHPVEFPKTDLGREVVEEAAAIAGDDVDPSLAVTVVLCADKMTPGKASPEFGPAKTLHERFLWSLFQGDPEAFEQFREGGYDKGAIRSALEYVDRPVLILIDELMDYGLMLSQEGGMAGEQAFLNALFDTVDDLPQVVAVVVMIRSELDEQGFPDDAEEFRDYLTSRLERNGTTVTVTDAHDFASIIRRRLFEAGDIDQSVQQAARAWRSASEGAWRENVFNRLPTDRGIESFEDRLAHTYPFHPDLMELVEMEWSRHTGFQRVRSTVTIFAATAYHWQRSHEEGSWAPPLIGLGDIPLSTMALEAVLSSGLLHGSDKAIINFRQVAASDIVTKDGQAGRAVSIDLTSEEDGEWRETYPCPAQRMATAMYMYSLVPRTQTRKGATKPEILAAAFVPSDIFSYQEADSVFGRLTDDENGLGSLEVFQGTGGNTPTRYVISTEMTLRMFFRRARSRVNLEERDQFVWERSKSIARKGGGFDEIIFIEQPEDSDASTAAVFGDVDQARSNRMVVLDARRWTLLNGSDSATREDIRRMLGVGDEGLHVLWASSAVVVCVNTQKREQARKRATEVVAWKRTAKELQGSEHHSDAVREYESALARLDGDLRKAYQHYAYLYRKADDQIDVAWKRLEDDMKTALSGNLLWDELVDESRAVHPSALSGSYLRNLISVSDRRLTVGEVTDWFWANPSFPLVPKQEDIRTAVYTNLKVSDGWDVVTADGQVLSYDSAQQIPVRSKELYLVPKQPAELEEPEQEEKSGSEVPTEKSVTYRRYTMGVPNRSVAKLEQRQKLYNLLMELARLVDPASLTGVDIQIIDLEVTITAEQGSVDSLRKPVDDIDGTWKDAEDLI